MSRFFANGGFIEGGSQYPFSTDLFDGGPRCENPGKNFRVCSEPKGAKRSAERQP
jgi:hypothetical protein